MWRCRFCSHKGVNNQREIDKGEKDNIEFIIAGENAAKAFDTPKQALDLISLFVQMLIIFSRINIFQTNIKSERMISSILPSVAVLSSAISFVLQMS